MDVASRYPIYNSWSCVSFLTPHPHPSIPPCFYSLSFPPPLLFTSPTWSKYLLCDINIQSSDWMINNTPKQPSDYLSIHSSSFSRVGESKKNPYPHSLRNGMRFGSGLSCCRDLWEFKELSRDVIGVISYTSTHSVWEMTRLPSLEQLVSEPGFPRSSIFIWSFECGISSYKVFIWKFSQKIYSSLGYNNKNCSSGDSIFWNSRYIKKPDFWARPMQSFIDSQ